MSASAQLGGAERILLEIFAGIKATMPGSVLKLALNSDGPLIAKAQAIGADVCVIPMPPALLQFGDYGAGAADRAARLALVARFASMIPQTIAYCAKLRKAIREFGPDLVHSNGFKMHILGAWAAPADIPVVWHVHDYVGRRLLMRHLMRLHAKRCRAAIANSDDVAADLREACGAGLRIFRVYNGIDAERFSPDGARLDLDGLAGLSPPETQVIRVGLVATMARWKGHEVFLRALSQVQASTPIRGYIIGGPIYQTAGSERTLTELRELARTLKIGDRVGFTGFIDQVPRALRSLDIVVHASTAPEPFGMVIAEAMACGKPVIVSCAGGAAELIADEEDALGCPPGDASALASRIQRLACDAELRARLGRRARASAIRSFNRKEMTDRILSVYRTVTTLPAAAHD